MRVYLSVLVLIAGFSAATLAADSQPIWQIGTVDHDSRDLANPTGFSAYLKSFPKDVHFVIGQSDPRKDFNAIHPGPLDDWAGHREHPFQIAFNLPSVQPGTYELRIDLLDTHASQPPVLRVSVNGQQGEVVLEAGVGDITLEHPEKGKARTLRFFFGPERLRTGANQIELCTIRGSWMMYDSVSLRKLSADTKPAIEVSVRPSLFFVERDGRLKQEFAVSAIGIASDETVKVEVNSGADRLESVDLGKAALGTLSKVVDVGETTSPRQLVITVSAGGQTGSKSITQIPQRKWRIYVAPATHTDIGYTDIQSRVIEVHNRNTDLALALVGEFPLYHWNLESSWAAQIWLREQPPYLHDAFYEAVRQKRIGVEAGYLNMLTGLCSEEELIRMLYYSARLHREHGVPFVSATLTDAPSHVWGLPSILAGAGIRYLSVGINTTRAPVLNKNIHLKSPFWWQGPDGQRILTWFTSGYSQAGHIGLGNGFHRMREAVERYLNSWEHREDYPYDAILLHGAYSDNVAIGREMAETITEYSKQYAYPKVIICANNDFFEYIEKNFADKIQTVRGCGGSWWEDGAGSSAVETGINRVVHQDIIAAETVWAALTGLNKSKQFPQADFNRVWDNILLYDEHTWGAHNSIETPTSDFVQRQWAVKAAYATDAAHDTQHLLESGLIELASHVAKPSSADSEGLLVFNPSGRTRTDIVQATIPQGTLVMGDGGALDQQMIREDNTLKNRTVRFIAKDVPAAGYRTYRVAASKLDLARPKRFDGKVLENDFYRVTFDAATGGISSLMDKKLAKELVDQTSNYKLGQLIYAAGGGVGGKTQVECPNPKEIKLSLSTAVAIEPGASGPIFSSAKSISKMPLLPRIEMEVFLYEQDRRVDFIFRLSKQMTYEKEAVYIAFPFAGKNPRFRYEVGGGNVRPNEDQFPGACRDWFSVQRWVTVNTDDSAVAWSPIDTPLIMLCDLNAGKWLDTLPITNGTIFAYVMNNYWFTNYKAGQDRDFTFRYSLTSDAAIEPAAASRFGEATMAPLRAVRMLGETRVTPQWQLPVDQSFCRVEPDSVTLTALKRADDGNGLILRIRETAGNATDVTITEIFKNLKKVSLCDLVERVQKPLPMDGGKIKLKIEANAIATLRLE